MPIDQNTLTVIASVALISAAGVVWLEARFRSLERSFWKGKNESDKVVAAHALRIQRLEILTTGKTETP